MIWYNVHLGKNNVKCDKWFPQELGEKYLKADGKRMKLEEKVKKLETRPFKIELRVTSSFEAASSVLPREHGCLLLTSPISPPSQTHLSFFRTHISLSFFFRTSSWFSNRASLIWLLSHIYTKTSCALPLFLHLRFRREKKNQQIKCWRDFF